MNKLTAQQWGRIIGCKVYFSETHPFEDKVEETKFKLAGIRIDGEHISLFDDQHNDYNAAYCKPILRTFDQMTEEEKTEYWGLWANDDCDHVDYMDSIYIDQRDWIEADLAIKEGDNA